MKSLRGSILAAAILMASALRADVTIRYQTDFKPVGSPRAGAADPIGKVLGKDLSFSIRMKGNKGRVNSDGSTMIVDFVKLELTLLDSEHRQYAIIPTSEYAGKVAGVIAGMGGPGLDVFGAMKTKVESTSMGRSEVIQGVLAEERQITFTMQTPEPGAASPSDLSMKIVMQIWTAKPGEALRLPAIRELAGFNLWQKLFLNPVEMLGPLAPKSSDTGNAMEKLFAEIGKNQSVLLRMHMEMFMPSMGALAAQTAGQPAATPFMQMTQEVAEISTAPVDDTEFLVPADYTAAPFEQVLAATFSAKTTAAQSEAVSASGPASNPPLTGGVQAYVPLLTPVHHVEPDLTRAQGVQGMVELLVTVDPQGHVAAAEALTGPDVLRKPAIEAVMQWTFRPVMRDGHAVMAYTSANVDFVDWTKGPGGSIPPVDETMAAMERLSSIEKAMPRSPQQVLADLEQDSGGGDAMRRYYALDQMAQAALKAGDEAKAAAYANELLHGKQQDATNWNYGNAIHDGHMVLGLIAVRHGDIPAARQQLLEAGKTPGSPQLDSFGPSMALAKELLEKGERDAVLEYFSECRSFWKMGTASLDAWSETVKKGGTPGFGGNLR
jgi:hypothetical protein